MKSLATAATTATLLLSLAPAAVLSVPATAVKRQSIESITDNLSFVLTLPQFTARRNAQDPPTLDWSSDGCTSSPDNPLGFPFEPACNRHDFGYRNFRIQSRFTTGNKLRIDNQFRTDLRFQCQSATLSSICNALAEVYYAAVRAFGGSDATPGKRDANLVKIYEEKVAIYNALVEEARREGLLPPE